jgi:hypothetical protein
VKGRHVAALVGGLALVALLAVGLRYGRYSLVNAGNGVVYKVDRFTGRSTVIYGNLELAVEEPLPTPDPWKTFEQPDTGSNIVWDSPVPTPTCPPRALWRLLRRGMTQAQVVGLLGQPLRVDAGYWTYLYYSLNGKDGPHVQLTDDEVSGWKEP